MFLETDDKKTILSRLPVLELSYEPKIHMKVQSPLFYIIPKGPKALIWYTYWKEQHYCFLIKINDRGNYSDIQCFHSSFSNKMALGTIIYGTYFIHNNQHFFTCEQLHYYHGKQVKNKKYTEKLNLLLNIFENDIDQISYVKNTLIIGMPVITYSYEDALNKIDVLPYNVYGIGIPSYIKKNINTSIHNKPHDKFNNSFLNTNTNTNTNKINKLTQFKAVFKVKSSLESDNYKLYTADDIFYENMLIRTYKSSILMNGLFRNIKENTNLDLLEESDDEDDFENNDIDKYVNLNKVINMECVYSIRFKKWEPIRVITNNNNIITVSEINKLIN